MISVAGVNVCPYLPAALEMLLVHMDRPAHGAAGTAEAAGAAGAAGDNVEASGAPGETGPRAYQSIGSVVQQRITECVHFLCFHVPSLCPTMLLCSPHAVSVLRCRGFTNNTLMVYPLKR